MSRDSGMFSDGTASSSAAAASRSEAHNILTEPLNPKNTLKPSQSPAIRALEQAFGNPAIRNIAVTGPYGSG